MAKKDDLDLDFGDDDLDLSEFDLSFEPTEKIKDDRSPIVKDAANVAEGVKKAVFSENSMRLLLKNAAPREFRDTADLIGDTVYSVQNEYDKTMQKLAPSIKEFKRSAEAFRRTLGNAIPEGMNKWLESKLKEEGGGSKGPSQEEIANLGIEKTILGVFQQQQQAEGQARQEQQVMQVAQAKTQTDQLNSTNQVVNQLTRLVNYQEGINLGWQKEMLRVSLRQYNVQATLLKGFSEFSQNALNQLQSIVKNTALPDLAKQTDKEVLKDISLRRFFGWSQNTLRDKLRGNKLIGKTIKHLSNKANDMLVDPLQELMGGLTTIMDMQGQAMEMEREMAALTGGAVSGDQKELIRQQLMQSIGEGIGSKFFGSMGMRLGTLAMKNKTISGAAAKAGNVNEAIGDILNNFYRNGIKPGEDGKLGLVGKGLNWFRDAADLDQIVQRDTKVGAINWHTSKNLHDPRAFDNYAHKSITEIIPGYLARILQSSEGIRTGHMPDLLLFSNERDTFVSSSRHTKDLADTLFKRNSDVLNGNLDNFVEKLGGKDLTSEDKAQLRKNLVESIRNGEGMDLHRFMKDDDKLVKGLSSRGLSQLRNGISSQVKFNDKGKIALDDKESSDNNLYLYRRFDRLRGDIPNFVDHVKDLARQGLVNTDTLKAMGIVASDGKDSHSIDTDKLYDILLSGDYNQYIKEDVSTQGAIPTGGFRRRTKGTTNERRSTSAPYISGVTGTSSPISPNADYLSAIRDNTRYLEQIAQDVSALRTRAQGDQATNKSEDTESVSWQTLDASINIQTSAILNSLARINRNIIDMGVGSGSISDDKGRDINSSEMTDSLINWKKLRRYTQDGRDFIQRKAMDLYQKAKDTTNRFVGAVRSKVLNPLFNKGSEVKESVLLKFDLYSPDNLKEPLVKARDLALGKYCDINGKVIRSFSELKGHLCKMGEDGKPTIVATVEELQNAVDKAGNKFDINKIRGLGANIRSWMQDKINQISSNLNISSQLNRAKDFGRKVLNRITDALVKDVYVGDERSPRITANQLINGVYFCNGKPLRQVRDIVSDVVDHDGNVILSLSEMRNQGLFDKDGKPYKDVLDNLISNVIVKPFQFGKQMLKGGIDFLGSLGNKFKSLFGGVFGGWGEGITFNTKWTKRIYELLVWKFGGQPDHHMKDIASDNISQATTGDIVKDAKKRAESIKKRFGNAKNFAGWMADKAKKMGEGFNVKDGIQDYLKEKAERAKAKKEERERARAERAEKRKSRLSLDGLKGFGTGIIDRFTGKRRKGSWMDRVMQYGNKDSRRGAMSKLFGRKGSQEDANQGFLSKLGMFIPMILAAIKGAPAAIGSILLKPFQWIGGALNGVLKVVGGVGGFIKGALTGKGTGLGAAAGKVVHAGGKLVGRAGLAAGKFVANSALRAGAAILGTPTGWALLGIAAVGWFGYKLWQYYRDNFQEMDEYRLASYGIHPNNDVGRSNVILAFEKEMDKELLVDPQTGYLKEKEIDMNKWAAFFWNEEAQGALTQEQMQNEQLPRFTMWYKERFYPVYKRHKEALFAMMTQAEHGTWSNIKQWFKGDNGRELYNLEGLEDGYKPSFVRMSFLDKDKNPGVPDIYSYTSLPFSDYEEGGVGYDQVRYYAVRVTEAFREDEKDIIEDLDDNKKDGTGNGFLYEDLFANRDKLIAQREQYKADVQSGNITVNGQDKDNVVVAGNADTKVKIKVGDGAEIEVPYIEAVEQYGLKDNRVSNLQAMRFIAYGLLYNTTDYFSRNHMEVILELEKEVRENHMRSESRDGAQGSVTWSSGEEGLKKVWSLFAVKFGFKEQDENNFKIWVEWFKHRFCAIYFGLLATAWRDIKDFRGKNAKDLDKIAVAEQMPLANFLMSKPVVDIIKNESDKVNDTGRIIFAGVAINNSPDAMKEFYENIKAEKESKPYEMPLSEEKKKALQEKWQKYMADEEKRREEVKAAFQQDNGSSRGQYIDSSIMAADNSGARNDSVAGYTNNGAPLEEGGVSTPSYADMAGTYQDSGYKPPSASQQEIIDEYVKLARADGVDDNHIAMYLGMMDAESQLKPQSENMKYSTENLLKIKRGEKGWEGYVSVRNKLSSMTDAQIAAIANDPNRQQILGNLFYGGRMGNGPTEGYMYRGRGLVQITGKENYVKYAKLAGYPEVIANPDLMNDPKIAVAVAHAYAKDRGLYRKDFNGMVQGIVGSTGIGDGMTKRMAAYKKHLANISKYGQGSGVTGNTSEDGTITINKGDAGATVTNNVPGIAGAQTGANIASSVLNMQIPVVGAKTASANFNPAQYEDSILGGKVFNPAQYENVNRTGGNGQSYAPLLTQPGQTQQINQAIPTSLGGPVNSTSVSPAEYKWIQIASKEIGVKEQEGSSHNPRILEYFATCNMKGVTDELPWCSAFANWVITQAGMRGTNSASSQSWLDWSGGQRFNKPVYGALVVFKWKTGGGHVGFVVGMKSGKLAVLGGNQGNMVKVSGFPTNDVVGYILPTGVQPVYDIPEYKGDMNVYNSGNDARADTRGPSVEKGGNSSESALAAVTGQGSTQLAPANPAADVAQQLGSDTSVIPSVGSSIAPELNALRSQMGTATPTGTPVPSVDGSAATGDTATQLTGTDTFNMAPTSSAPAISSPSDNIVSSLKQAFVEGSVEGNKLMTDLLKQQVELQGINNDTLVQVLQAIQANGGAVSGDSNMTPRQREEAERNQNSPANPKQKMTENMTTGPVRTSVKA